VIIYNTRLYVAQACAYFAVGVAT